MTTIEHALRFACSDNWLIGVLHLPDDEQPLSRGVLVVTGGPQYRAGSHRQFVLLARGLAAAGIAVMRFDYRGMGDSEGAIRNFENIGDDLDAAMQHFFVSVPALREIVLWGLCDGASAAAFYAIHDPRISGLVLLNPWVRSGDGWSPHTLRHYYRQRLLSPGFWRQQAVGMMTFSRLRSLKEKFQELFQAPHTSTAASLPARLHSALAQFPGPILIVLSGADLGAREFSALSAQHRQWRELLRSERITVHEIPGANHTFARRAWRDRVAALCLEWITSW